MHLASCRRICSHSFGRLAADSEPAEKRREHSEACEHVDANCRMAHIGKTYRDR